MEKVSVKSYKTMPLQMMYVLSLNYVQTNDDIRLNDYFYVAEQENICVQTHDI